MSAASAGIYGVLGCGQQQRDGRRGGGGAMLDGEQQAGAGTCQIEVGVAPGPEVA